MSPLYMKNVFIQKEVTYGLRDVNLLVQPKFKTVTYGHNTIKYQGSKLWDNLPNDLKKMNSLSSFKCEIQKWSATECHQNRGHHRGTSLVCPSMGVPTPCT